MLPELAGHMCSETQCGENCDQSPPNIKCDNMAVTSRQNISAAVRAFNCAQHFETEKNNVEGVPVGAEPEPEVGNSDQGRYVY